MTLLSFLVPAGYQVLGIVPIVGSPVAREGDNNRDPFQACNEITVFLASS